ncbi:hypothetical protein V9K67_12665 [Paraflavisolibacter sp. H34]|uniref:hypothetical protein n=1 Tax=Huijunlia imazamoxiresistens TaxID=3127457 RepID=UPI003016F063
MDKELQLNELIKSHIEIQKHNLIEWNSFRNKSHIGAIPFGNKDLHGDFIYNENKINKRYSPLFEALNDEGYIHDNCLMDTGYTTLIVCRKIGATKGNKEISFKHYSSFTKVEGKIENRFCVFQDPLTKLSQHGHFDILGIYPTADEAQTFSLHFTRSEEISTVIAKIKFCITWH